ELRAWGAGVGDPDRARGRRRGRAVGGLGAPAPPALVGVDRQLRVGPALPAQGDPLPGLRRSTTRGRLALLLLAARLGRARTPRGLPLPDATLLADPRLRRLL